MTAAVILFLVFVMAVWYTAVPLFSPDKKWDLNSDDGQQDTRLTSILAQIREAEFEHDMGIVADEDFNRIQAELNTEAADLIKQDEGKTESAETNHTCSSCGLQLVSSYTFCPDCGQSLSQDNVCTSCGNSLTESDKFCNQCGKQV